MKNLFLFLTITLIKINFLFAQPSSDLSILLNKNESFQGSFNQIVFDNQGQIIEEANGKVIFKKPHFFKWIYKKPHQNQIISDGEIIYIYDPDLSQVIMSQFSQSNSNNPSLIFFQKNIEKFFKVTTKSINGELWYRCQSLSDDADYETLELKFDSQGKVLAMNIIDRLKNKILVNFEDIQTNIKINEATFLFNVPENVEIIKN
ncbi:outer membrane lipoprotein chaperone LolA [Methylophilaceae bacterium]|nr:outer membrane lipoprotein chaperone LolA [Methylophilaceae bacterium]